MVRAMMLDKEIQEARRVGIPERIIQKMVREGDLSEREREIVRDHAKVFVPGYMKGNTLVRSQLRNLPNQKSDIIKRSKLSKENKKLIEQSNRSLRTFYYGNELIKNLNKQSIEKQIEFYNNYNKRGESGLSAYKKTFGNLDWYI